MKLTHEKSVQTWEDIAEWWDDAIGDGDIFHTTLVFPEMIKALQLFPKCKVLDLACGNGALSRKISLQGADVIGIDVSQTFIKKAQERALKQRLNIIYLQCDLTNFSSLNQTLAQYGGFFDKVICSMALHDISNIAPMIATLSQILQKDGAIVISIPHPCFNSGKLKFITEPDQKELGVFRNHYLSNQTSTIKAKSGQPLPHINYHRSLSTLLTSFFEYGYKLTYCAEPSMQNLSEHSDFFWSKLPEIPPVMILRFSK